MLFQSLILERRPPWPVPDCWPVAICAPQTRGFDHRVGRQLQQGRLPVKLLFRKTGGFCRDCNYFVTVSGLRKSVAWQLRRRRIRFRPDDHRPPNNQLPLMALLLNVTPT